MTELATSGVGCVADHSVACSLHHDVPPSRAIAIVAMRASPCRHSIWLQSGPSSRIDGSAASSPQRSSFEPTRARATISSSRVRKVSAASFARARHDSIGSASIVIRAVKRVKRSGEPSSGSSVATRLSVAVASGVGPESIGASASRSVTCGGVGASSSCPCHGFLAAIR